MIRKGTSRGTLCKQVVVKIVVPTQKQVVHHIHAAPGTWFGETHIHDILMEEETMLERDLPQYEFRMVEVKMNQINFVGEPR